MLDGVTQWGYEKVYTAESDDRCGQHLSNG